jgi:Tol biopolymer transport system component
MSADGSNPVLLKSHDFASPGWGDYCVCAPTWSPDGLRIAFVRANYEDVWQIFTMLVDGSSDPMVVYDGVGAAATQDAPAWSPDGTRIAFGTVASASSDVIASRRWNGADFRTHATNPTGFVGDPDWSPDGASLVFSQASPRGNPTRIYVVRSNGSVQQLIPQASNPVVAGYWDRNPAWSRTP